jgi:predicted kinase
MPSKPAPANTAVDAALPERRAARQAKSDATNPLARLKGALNRPVTMEWRNGQPHVVLVERRRAPFLDREQAHLCAELGAVLLTQHADEASTLLKPLLAVHHKLKRKGWDGVAALPSPVLAKALRQAEMLAAEDPSLPVLTQVAERLRPLLEAAEARARAQDDDAIDTDLAVLEVREASFNEFEELERTWAQTMPSGLAPLDTVR